MAIALWMPRLQGPIDLRYDAGVYYTLGTALAEGRGYRLLNEPGEIEAIQYPPLLPLIVAGHQWLTGTADPAVTGRALRWTFAALFVGYALAVFVFTRRWSTTGWSLIATVLVLLNVQLLWLSDALFAELPFALCTVLFLIVAGRSERRGLAALFAAAAYGLRTSGLALLAAWVADALWQRRPRESLVRALLAALPVVAWHAHMTHVQAKPEYRAPAYAYQRAPYQFYNVDYPTNLGYVDAFAPERGFATAEQLVERMAANALALPVDLGESISVRAAGPLAPVFRLNPPAPPWSPARAAAAAIGLAAGAGLVLAWRAGVRLAPLAWVLSLALAVVTPFPSQFARYLTPLAPITALGFSVAMATTLRSRMPLLQAAVAAAIGVLVAAELVALTVVFGARRQDLFFYPVRWRTHDATLAWLGRTAAPDAVVATSTPHRLFLTTGLHAVMPPFEPDVAEAERLLDDVPIAYLVIDDLDFLDVSRRYAARVVAAHPDRWTLVFGAPDGGSRVYRSVTSR